MRRPFPTQLVCGATHSYTTQANNTKAAKSHLSALVRVLEALKDYIYFHD